MNYIFDNERPIYLDNISITLSKLLPLEYLELGTKSLLTIQAPSGTPKYFL